MAKRDDIKRELKRQENEIYGEGTLSGSSPDPESDDDVIGTLNKTVGANINPGDEFHLADEIVKDEAARKPGADLDDDDQKEAEE